jgi:hypothetical protein
MTVSGLGLTDDIELDGENAIVRLEPADIAEIQEWLTIQFVRPLYPFKVYRNAIVTKTASDPRSVTSRILHGLQVFAPSHVETGVSLFFDGSAPSEVAPAPGMDDVPIVPITGGFESPHMQSYREAHLTVDLSDSRRVEELRDWVGHVTEIDIAPDSLMARALMRYSRSLHNDYMVEVITDLVIGLETLLMPARDDEISYRVRQRAGFMAGNTPVKRLELASLTGRAYGVRSGAVHTSEASSDATPELADKCREILRVCIKSLLQAEPPLRNQFCQVATTKRGRRDDKAEIHRFYEALIAFGSFQQAYEYWHSPNSRDAQSSSSEMQA